MECKNRQFFNYGLVVALIVQAVVLLAYIQVKTNPTLQGRLIPSESALSAQLYSNISNHNASRGQDSFNVTSDTTELRLWPPRGLVKENANPFITESYILQPDTTPYYFHISKDIFCMTFGTDKNNSTSKCVCKRGWYGEHCSIPESVHTSSSYNQTHGHTQPTFVSRRIINVFTFNREWAMLEARMNELGALVDVFVILESNYTLHGDPKGLWLLEKLKKGYLKEFHHKIFYILLDHFPEGGRKDGWLAEDYYRNYLFTHGVRKIKGTLPSDLFMFNDADELPSFEAILFLKLHQGYSEPVGFYMNGASFGFFWTMKKLLRITAVSSLKFLEEVADNDVQCLRGQKYRKIVRKKRKADAWYIGSEKAKAGWHCSWCMPLEDVRNKLVSAINADFPRWGDFPEKRELTYIKKLIKTGTWFNDKRMDSRNVTYQSDPSIAPSYIRNNAKQFRYLLDVHYAATV